MKMTEVTMDNMEHYGLFCIKNTDNPGFQGKREWLSKRFGEGLKMVYVLTDDDEPAAYIEYVPGSKAWRPIDAPEDMIIHCIAIMKREHRGKGYAQALVERCIEDAKALGLKGVAVMTSKGSWFPDTRIFDKMGFIQVDKKEKYELMALSLSDHTPPRFIDWKANLPQFQGWHLIYSYQCSALYKSLDDLAAVAKDRGIDLQIHEMESAEESRQTPTPSGLFALIHDGKLLNMHYTSAKRFESLLKQESA